MSGLASSAPKAPRNKPSGTCAGPVNHWSPVPDTWMPKSVPLRAIATTIVEPSMSRAASSASLHAGIARLRKKWSLPPTKRSALAHVLGRVAGRDHRRGEVAEQHQRAGPVAVVRLVAHLQHLGEDPGDVDRPGGAHGGTHRVAEQRAEHARHPAQPSQHLRPVGAVAQHLAEALVEGAVRAAPRGLVLQHEHPHRRGHHARHRPDRAAVVARTERDPGSGLEECGRVVGVLHQALERRGAHECPAQRTGRAVPGDRWAGVQELAVRQPEHLRRRCDVDQHGLDAEQRLDGAARSLRYDEGRAPPWRGRPRCPPSAAASRHGATAVPWDSTAPASRSAPTVVTPASGVVGEVMRAPGGRGRCGWPRRWRGTPRRRPRPAPRPGG